MNIITMKARSAIGLFFGLLTAANWVYAQEAVQKTLQPVGSVAGNPSASYEALLRDAEALIKSGKPGDAYNLLEPLEFEHAGEVRFDYLIGIAALDSGKPDKATLAFERVLAVDPDSAAARLDMARAYYQLRDFPRAETEFTAALKQNPSEATRTNIQKYLDAIAAQKDGKRTRFSGYVELGVGRDSNVNNSTDQSQILFFDNTIPTWATATLDPANVKTSDNYYAAAAGGEIKHSLNAHWGLYAGADLRKHANRTHTPFDSVNPDVRAGVVYEAQATRLRVGAVGGQYDLGGARNSDTAGIKAELRHVFSPINQLNAFAQSVQYRYVDPFMKPNDIDQQAAGIGWLHVLADGKSTLSGSVHYGAEKDVSPIIEVNIPPFGLITANPSGGRNDGGKRFGGLRIGGQTSFVERTTLFASAGMQTGVYDKVNYLFLRQRKDRLYDLKLGANWHWSKLWTLRPQLNYSRNDSNIAIYGYDRMDVSLNFRRDFR